MSQKPIRRTPWGEEDRNANKKTTHLSSGFKWWALRDSNPRPSPCKGDALPAELNALNHIQFSPRLPSGDFIFLKSLNAFQTAELNAQPD